MSHKIWQYKLLIQGSPFGRGLSYVDLKFGIVLYYSQFILWQNFEFDVNKQCSATRWAALHMFKKLPLESEILKIWLRSCLARKFSVALHWKWLPEVNLSISKGQCGLLWLQMKWLSAAAAPVIRMAVMTWWAAYSGFELSFCNIQSRLSSSLQTEI